jgi:hypothetical protein
VFHCSVSCQSIVGLTYGIGDMDVLYASPKFERANFILIEIGEKYQM